MGEITLFKKIISGLTLSILLASIFSSAQAQDPYWADVGIGATYRGDFRLPQFGEGQYTMVRWTINSLLDTPLIKGATIYLEIGTAADFYDVPFVTGDPIIFLPQSAFRGALSTELELEGFGAVPVYKKIIDWDILQGEAYYDKRSGIILRADLAGTDNVGNEAWFNFWVISASPGLVNPQPKTPTAVPTQAPSPKIMGLEPMAFYTVIIVLAIIIVGAVVTLSLRRKPHRYPPPPPPPPP